MDKQERFQTAYNYLRFKGLIHIQKDLALILKTSNTNISSALNGSEAVLTDKFLRRFSQAFKDTFNTMLNRRLHRLLPFLSTYWARHTWATVAASLDIPKETIAAALGHSIGSPITSIYINFDMRKVDEANRRVIDHVLEKCP